MGEDLSWLKHYCCTEMTEEGSWKFREYLLEHNIDYEVSGAFNLIHFHCYMTDDEMEVANRWIVENIGDV